MTVTLRRSARSVEPRRATARLTPLARVHRLGRFILRGSLRSRLRMTGLAESRALRRFALDALLLPCGPDHQKLARPVAADDPASLDLGRIGVERSRIVDRVIARHRGVVGLAEGDGAAAAGADERCVKHAAGGNRRGTGLV